MNLLLLTLITCLFQSPAGTEAVTQPLETDLPTPRSAWRFESDGFNGGIISDRQGDFDLRLVKGGLVFTGEGTTQAVLLPDGARALDLARDVDPAPLLPSDAFSIASWVRVDQPRDWAGLFSAIQDNGAYERGLVSGISGNRFFLGLVGDEGDEKITYLYAYERVETGRWHHVVATWDGRAMRLFIDGRPDAVSRQERGSVNWPPRTTIALAAYTDDDSRYSLVGGLHSVELYDVALDKGQIERLHAELAGAFPEPVTPDDDVADLPAETTVGWPTFRRDASRSAATPESLERPLMDSWRHRSPNRPRPSWPEPARSSFWQNIDEIVPRVIFDQCYHPVSDGRVVLYGSSGDDHVRCLDLETGAIRWTHGTNGPVRFAPVIDGDGAIFASDDGTIRRVDLEDGDLIWLEQLAPDNDRVVGNGRLISAWPPRTGVVLDRGLISITSGLFPRFGTHALTLDARTGETRWRVELPGTSPQGYLLASPSRLFIPTGRTTPLMLGRGDGRSLGRFQGPGGTFAVLVENELLTGPGSKGELSVADQRTQETVAGFDAEHGIVTSGLIILARDGSLTAIDRSRLQRVTQEREMIERHHAELLSRREEGEPLGIELEATAERLLQLQGELVDCRLWNREVTADSLALADDELVVGGPGFVSILDARTGDELEAHAVEGRALGLAVAGGRLIVSTSRGDIHCFGPTRGSDAVAPDRSVQSPVTMIEGTLAELITEQGMDRGLAVVTDARDAGLALQLAHTLRLHVVIIEPDPDRVVTLRREVMDADAYGDQVVVLHAEPADTGIDRVANLVISDGGLGGSDSRTAPTDLARLVRPAGGLLITGHTTNEDALPGFDAITSPVRGAFRRRALPGAGDWTHPYADAAKTTNSGDTRLSESFALRWFGGPGAERMVDRHLRTTASLAKDGRLFIPGNDVLIAVDAYNGMELWSMPLPGFTRTGAPYDGGWWAIGFHGLLAAANDKATWIDPKNGSVLGRHRIPDRARERCGPVNEIAPRCEWGWLAIEDDHLLGSAALPGAARLEQHRDAVVDQYSELEPLATSRALFSIDQTTGREEWVYGEGVIINSTIAVRDGRVIFVESLAEPALADLDGRIRLSELRRGALNIVALELETGRRLWKSAIDGDRFDHSLFLSLGPEQLALVGCTNDEKINRYEVAVHDVATGRELWRDAHANNRQGTGGDHGEQVHHPVLLDGVLIAEPRAYDLGTGERIDPAGGSDFFLKSRTGCGTISASDDCLFFRDGNPVVLELASGNASPTKLTQASRQGCWVNVIPAQGMALIPESSSGCVCGYSLQTSIGLVPVD